MMRRINISVMAPWLLGDLKRSFTWRIWTFHAAKLNDGVCIRVLGIHVGISNSAGWRGIGFSINF